MSATEELRRLLDERGMEHFDIDERTLWGCTESGCYPYSAIENFGGSLNVHTHAYDLTPAQAIAATLGSGTCRYELRDGWYKCSNCGRSTRAYEGKGDPLSPPNFCPTCGAKVVDA